MTLQFTNGAAFAEGACQYQSRPASPTDRYERPFLQIRVEGQLIEAALDTGGFFLILKPEIASLLNLQTSQGYPCRDLVLRGKTFEGHMHRVTLTLEAERGNTYDVEVTAFVPVEFGEYPNFIGWSLCLERFRFALEPPISELGALDGWFHYGPLDQS